MSREFYGENIPKALDLRARNVVIDTGLQLLSGSPSAGDVLTSDALGNATWQTIGGDGQNITISNPNPSLTITNSDNTSSNPASINLITHTNQVATIYQDSAGALNIQNNTTNGNINITQNGLGDFNIFAGAAISLNTGLFPGTLQFNGDNVFTTIDLAVTQTGSITTAVTANGITTLITTVSASIAAGSNAVFTMNNSSIIANSVPMVTCSAYSGTGIPYVMSSAIAVGSLNITIYNIHPTDPLNSTLKISVAIF
jgi:hypothetical protein